MARAERTPPTTAVNLAALSRAAAGRFRDGCRSEADCLAPLDLSFQFQITGSVALIEVRSPISRCPPGSFRDPRLERDQGRPGLIAPKCAMEPRSISMTYRDILVSLDHGPAQKAVSDCAADLASKFDAALLGAFARSQIPPPFVPADGAAFLSASEIQRIFDGHEKTVREAAETARNVLEAAAQVHGVTSEWTDVADAAALTACARRTDLVVLPGGKTAAADALTPASLAMASGAPALVVPATEAPTGFARVLVAWNGSREAARALHSAWPILRTAEAVDVLRPWPHRA